MFAAFPFPDGGSCCPHPSFRHSMHVPELYYFATPSQKKKKVLAWTNSKSEKSRQIQSKICAMSVAAAVLAVIRLNVLVAALTSAYNIRLFAVKNFGRPWALWFTMMAMVSYWLIGCLMTVGLHFQPSFGMFGWKEPCFWHKSVSEHAECKTGKRIQIYFHVWLQDHHFLTHRWWPRSKFFNDQCWEVLTSNKFQNEKRQVIAAWRYELKRCVEPQKLGSLLAAIPCLFQCVCRMLCLYTWFEASLTFTHLRS